MQSKHLICLDLDLNCVSSSFEYTKEAKQLLQKIYKYNFIIRYPKNKISLDIDMTLSY